MSVYFHRSYRELQNEVFRKCLYVRVSLYIQTINHNMTQFTPNIFWGR